MTDQTFTEPVRVSTMPGTPEPPPEPIRHPDWDPVTGFAPPAPRSTPTPLSRDELRRRRRLEQVDGVPFHLDHDDITVRVRLLNVYERTTLQGLPHDLQALMLKAFNAQDILPKAGTRTLQDMIEVTTTEEETANQACIVGFVSPRLVATEAEADAAQVAGDPDVWWVGDVHIDDRKKYLRLISGQDSKEMAKIRSFLRTGQMAGVADR